MEGTPGEPEDDSACYITRGSFSPLGSVSSFYSLKIGAGDQSNGGDFCGKLNGGLETRRSDRESFKETEEEASKHAFGGILPQLNHFKEYLTLLSPSNHLKLLHAV